MIAVTSAKHTPRHSGLAEPGLEQVCACLFCGSVEAKLEYEGVRDFFFGADEGHFAYLRCNNCDSLWLKERPEGARLLKAYSGYYTHAAPQSATPSNGLRALLRSSYVRCRFAASSSLLDNIVMSGIKLAGRDNANIDEQYRFAPKAPASILDYGCGSGEYLLRMEPFGHELHGAEFDPQLLSDMARRGIVINDVAAIDDRLWQGKFDHITLAHVLEHVADPLVLLNRLASFLKPGGTLFVEVPNAQATGLAIFGIFWRGLEAPRHFALPSQTALIAAFRQAGFSVERQHIRGSARRWVWNESLSAVRDEDRPELAAKMASAPAEIQSNAEFLTFLVRKPQIA